MNTDPSTPKTLTLKNIKELSEEDTFNEGSGVDINLSNSAIEAIEDGVFEGSHYRVVDLSNNNLKDISASVFKNAMISHVNLTQNYFETVSKAMFEDVELIEGVTFDNNFIRSIETGALNKFAESGFVYFQNNLLECIPQGVFNSKVYFQLGLTGNNIKTISPQAFDKAAFEYLELSDNNLEEIHRNAFDGVLRIENLLLSNNNINVIEPHALDKVHKTVHLDGNRLEVIQKDALKYVRNIVLLNNNLRKIEVGAFDDSDRDDSLYPAEDKNKPRILYLEEHNILDEESRRYLNDLTSSGKFEWRYTLVDIPLYRVRTHVKNLENLETSGNFKIP